MSRKSKRTAAERRARRRDADAVIAFIKGKDFTPGEQLRIKSGPRKGMVCNFVHYDSDWVLEVALTSVTNSELFYERADNVERA